MSVLLELSQELTLDLFKIAFPVIDNGTWIEITSIGNNNVTPFLEECLGLSVIDSPFLPSDHPRASTWYLVAISINYPVLIVLPIMDDTRLHKYYRASGYGLNSLIYRFLIADQNLRRFFNLNAYCGAVTFITLIFALIMVICSIASLNTVTSNNTLFRELLEKTEKKLPRIESVVNIIPPYKCIHKHLQRMSVFQEKTKKMLCKEQLELEIMNSKMSCIEKLLKPEEQSEWRRSRSPKVYHRPIIAEMSK